MRKWAARFIVLLMLSSTLLMSYVSFSADVTPEKLPEKQPAVLAADNAKSESAAASANTSPEKKSASPEKATAAATPEKACVVEATIDGEIGPATLDFIKRSKGRAETHNCGSILLLINTPGGNLQTTRLIVEEILSSQIPFLCLVYPSGGHAGSAGAIILQACHLAGGVAATNIGAATPVSGTGEKIPDDLRKKLLNDTISWVEGLAKLRGRNETFARDIVESAKAVSSSEALNLKAIEFVGETKADFLKFAENKKIKMNENVEYTVQVGESYIFEQDLRYKVMSLLMNAQLAYLLFMGSLGLLYFELTHPGVILPGVVGGVGLIISLISLHMLDVTWGGVLLILLGIIFMIAEAFVAGFGVLGLGGVIAFFVGSLFLFDPETTGNALPLSLILPTTLLIGSIMMGIAYLAFTTRKKRRQTGFEQNVGKMGVITEVHPGDGKFGYIEIDGELWKCTSDSPLKVGDSMRVGRHQGLTLHVHLKKET